jgi:hypothetical protein
MIEENSIQQINRSDIEILNNIKDLRIKITLLASQFAPFQML